MIVITHIKKNLVISTDSFETEDCDAGLPDGVLDAEKLFWSKAKKISKEEKGTLIESEKDDILDTGCYSCGNQSVFYKWATEHKLKG